MAKVLWIAVGCLLFFNDLGLAQANHSWVIRKTEWSLSDEKNYSNFVMQIARLVETKQCRSLDSCLKHPQNPLRGDNPPNLEVFADCSRLPYILRGYFAWMSGLPFSFSTSVRPRAVEGNDAKDIRYSRFGNEIASRFDVVQSPNKRDLDGTAMMERLIDSVSSAHFRTNLDDSAESGFFSDFYNTQISRYSVVPGSVIYDPNGHVVVVGRVTEDGRIFYFDSHPDNSITWGMYGTKFVRSNPGQGSGFKKFRPLRLIGAKQMPDGRWVGGKISALKNSEIPDFSREQFFGNVLPEPTDWKQSRFVIDGRNLNFYEYVKRRLASGGFRESPVDEIRALTEDLCYNAKDRVQAVQTAITAGMSSRPAPDRLPYNIYGTEGDWETYSTPSRDARLKTSFKELRDLAETLFNRYQQRDPNIDYSGNDIKGDMLKAYLKVAQACKFNYSNSSGKSIVLDLERLRQRLWHLSFDPYHCPEMRWGANSASEMASCPRDPIKQTWYERQVWLRYQIERRYDVRMNYALDELSGPMPGVGVAAPPDIDVVRYLQN